MTLLQTNLNGLQLYNQVKEITRTEHENTTSGIGQGRQANKAIIVIINGFIIIFIIIASNAIITAVKGWS